MHQYQKTQIIPISIKEAWNFFLKPKNLEKITPHYLNFRILSRSNAEEMYPGMVITYRISPIFNISLSWATEITHIKDYIYFIDNQLQGPYKIWHHEHHFKEIDGGIEMRDILFYEIPFGFIGRLFHKLLVQKSIAEIFEYRKKKIKELFDSAVQKAL